MASEMSEQILQSPYKNSVSVLKKKKAQDQIKICGLIKKIPEM